MRLSLIIPTHNRAASLARAMRSALALDYPHESFELVVVDNASRDHTADVVHEIQATSGASCIRYVREDRLGSHYARHAGARAANGELLLFTDDDATFSPQWASAYAAVFNAHPEIAAAGGPVRAAWDVSPPEWLVEFIARKEDWVGGDQFFGPLSLMDLSDQLLIEPRGIFFSVNMAIRRDLLFEVGGFNPDISGGTWLGDGECGLFFKLWARGLLVGYVPDAEVHHHIPPERTTVDYVRRRWGNQAACDVYTAFHPKVPGRRALARQAVTTAARAARRSVKTARAWKRTDPASLRTQMEAAYEARRLAYTVRLIFDAKRRALVERDDWLESQTRPG